MDKYPKPINHERINIILNQMDNSICKINNGKDNFELGLFCKINYKEINIYALITTKIILNKIHNESVDIILKNKIINIKLGKTIYINRKDDIIIIEIKNNNNLNYIELDYNVYNNDELIYNNNESIYVIHYNSKEKNMAVSFGIINKLIESELTYSCNIKSDKKIIPIFNLSNNNLIGLHKSNSLYYNKGIFFRYMINEFIENYKYKYNNEINILININEYDINKKIYFLNNNEFIELNELNTNLYINDIGCEFKKYFTPKEKGEFNIKLEFNTKLKDCSFMFSGCDKIKSINFKSFYSKDIIDMNNMFSNCENLEDINLLSFESKQVINMSKMFYGCKKLKYLDLSSLYINDLSNMDKMFYNCFNLQNLTLYPFDKINNLNINNNFYGNNKLNPNDKKNKQNNDESNKIKDISSSNVKNNIQIKEFNIVFLGDIKKENNYSCYLLEKIQKEYGGENKNKIIIKKKKNKNIILNLLDGNEILKVKKFEADCLILEYDIGDNNSFEYVKNIWSKYIIYNNNNLIYLIGINFNNNNMIECVEKNAKKFSDSNKIKYISISSKNDNEIKNILNKILGNLEKYMDKIIFNFENKKQYNVIFLGDSATGAKTCLINRIAKNTFYDRYLSTIGVDHKKTKLELENEKQISLKLIDTAGQERFRSITFSILKGNKIDFIVLGYDITNKCTFDSLSGWIEKIKENSINTIKLIYLIGNKIDLEEFREVYKEEGQRFAKENNLRFFEAPCKTGEGIGVFLDDLKNEITKYEI